MNNRRTAHYIWTRCTTFQSAAVHRTILLIESGVVFRPRWGRKPELPHISHVYTSCLARCLQFFLIKEIEGPNGLENARSHTQLAILYFKVLAYSRLVEHSFQSLTSPRWSVSGSKHVSETWIIRLSDGCKVLIERIMNQEDQTVLERPIEFINNLLDYANSWKKQPNMHIHFKMNFRLRNSERVFSLFEYFE